MPSSFEPSLTEPELVLSEDLTPCCLVNTGVLIVRVSEWSRLLWHDVWTHQTSVKYHRKRYHEQSALLKQLQLRREGLPKSDLHGPAWHSYRGGPALKRFAHVAILPRHALNTNQHVALSRTSQPGAIESLAGEQKRAQEMPSKEAVSSADQRVEFLCGAAAEGRCDFVFHAAGLFKKISKLEALRSTLRAHGLGEHLPHGVPTPS